MYVKKLVINGEEQIVGAIVSDTAPANPETGTLWYDTVNSVLKIYDWANRQTV